MWLALALTAPEANHGSRAVDRCFGFWDSWIIAKGIITKLFYRTLAAAQNPTFQSTIPPHIPKKSPAFPWHRKKTNCSRIQRRKGRMAVLRPLPWYGAEAWCAGVLTEKEALGPVVSEHGRVPMWLWLSSGLSTAAGWGQDSLTVPLGSSPTLGCTRSWGPSSLCPPGRKGQSLRHQAEHAALADVGHAKMTCHGDLWASLESFPPGGHFI